ncbi:hypothetical protein ACHAXT_009265 [Thalassiosira profunda]
MADDPAAGPTGPTGATPKRRRIADDEEEESDGEPQPQMDVDAGDADANDAAPGGAGDEGEDAEARRRARLEARSADRRRRRLQAEMADLRDASFPGDEFYVGEQMQEVPDPNVLQDDAMDAEPGGDGDDLDDFVASDDDDMDEDGDYVGGDDMDGATAFVQVNRDSRRRGRGGRGGRSRRNAEEEEEEGEDLLENMAGDYKRIDALDTYGREGIDDRDYDGIDMDAFERAQATLDARDKERYRARQRGGRNTDFIDGIEAEIDEDEAERQARRGGRMGLDLDDFVEGGVGDEGGERRRDQMSEAEREEDFENEEPLNIEAFNVPLREFIATTAVRRDMKRRFRWFLKEFREGEWKEGHAFNLDRDAEKALPEEDKKRYRRALRNTPPLYEDRIRHMCSSNQAALEISYLHLMQKEPTLALWMDEAPRDTLAVLNDAATKHTLRLFPSYRTIRDEIHVRVSDVPILDSLRDLRRDHLDGLVKVSGVITRRGGVHPKLSMAYFDCIKCKATMGPEPIDDTFANSSGPEGSGQDIMESSSPSMCLDCDSEGPFKLNASRSKYRNFQKVMLQERPGSVPPGRVPRTKEVFFQDDLVDVARPGEEVEVTGIYCSRYDPHLTARSGFPVFTTYVAANHVRRKEDASAAGNLSEADRKEILELASDPNIGKRIVQSIAPSIYGHEHVKMSIAMSLFGAVPKNVNDKHRIRGDVNVLILGDPGTAKSQMLKYAESTAPRAVYSTGKGASAVGLTASVHKDPITREWTLEGGALVLADRGVCLIDEFDKMNEQDRTSIHEAMEQQSISVSKAGIVTSLQARCSVIAAANPIGGRYDSSCTLAENVELTDPILQRFDSLCVLQDTVDPVSDERLASFVTESHMMSVPTSDVARGAALAPERSRIESPDGVDSGDLIPQSLLRKYIQYARANCRPALRGGTFDQEKIASLYVQLRKESASSGGVPIAVRHIESIMRMAEAHAKMHLRDYVRDDDMDASIKMMLESFISAQKFSVRRSLRRSFAKFMSSGEDRVHLLLHILQDMMRNEAMYQTIRQQQLKEKDVPEVLEVPIEEFESRARDRRIYDVGDFCKGQAFEEAGYTLDTRRRVIVRNF